MTGYVNIVRADETWDLPDFDRFDWKSYKALDADKDDHEDEDEDEDNYDEGEPEIEGSRLYDVGWMMVDATSLVPAAYSAFIKSSSWDRLYCRLPKIMER